VPTGGRIVEVEAYHGVQDAASHAFRGPTPRTTPMFRAAGTLYIYMSYGIHRCLNITTGQIGEGQAVLIRALEPTIGFETMAERRGTTNMRLLTTGPGRLAQALGITLELSGQTLGATIELQPPIDALTPPAILTSPRIGISQAKNLPWRFYEQNNPFVTRAKL
jgi:DNA-3-methyladenine glycosylase